MSAGWAALGNGLPLVLCLPPCAGGYPHQDLLAHVGSLLFGGWAAYASWRAARASKQPLGHGGWLIPGAALVAVVTLYVLETAL